MDIFGKVLQAFLGGDRPRTWIDFLIVLALCGTYTLAQGLRFLHHERHRKAVDKATPSQLAALTESVPTTKAPRSAAPLLVLILAGVQVACQSMSTLHDAGYGARR